MCIKFGIELIAGKGIDRTTTNRSETSAWCVGVGRNQNVFFLDRAVGKDGQGRRQLVCWNGQVAAELEPIGM